MLLSLLALLVHTSALRLPSTHSPSRLSAVNPASSRQLESRRIVHAAALLLPITSFAVAARAGFFESTEQSLVNSISKYQAPVAELLDQLRPTELPNSIGVYTKQQLLRGGPEDSAVVLNYLETYIKPCQKRMAEAAPKLMLEGESQNRLELLPALMKGHILELQQAIDEQKADSQAREVEEVQETLAEYLLLASKKYEVTPYKPARPLSDKVRILFIAFEL